MVFGRNLQCLSYRFWYSKLILSASLLNSLACSFLFPFGRVAVVGNVDAGKSTMLGVLTHDELDNGRGLARQRLFRHKHEMESGRTSSVGNDILGFDSKGQVVNKKQAHGAIVNWERICRQSSKVHINRNSLLACRNPLAVKPACSKTLFPDFLLLRSYF